MTKEALADRMVNYADAAAAFSVVNSLAFLVALAETDVRCSLVSRQSLVIGGQIATFVIVAIAVVLLRRSELRVRASTPIADDVAGYLKTFFVVRIAVVAIAGVLTVAFAAIAVTDTWCPEQPG